jgi:hypothetical protein
MYRILKPGGVLVVIDVFLTNVSLNPFLKNVYEWFCKGWGLPNLIKLAEFRDYLKTAGFQGIEPRDLTKNVMPTIIRGDLVSVPYLFSTLFNKIIKGQNYQIENDPKFSAIVPLLTTILGIKKGISYNSVTAIK